MKKINIIGIGNILMGDDGFGAEVVNYLEKNYIIPDEIEIIDGGTGGIMLGGYITSCDSLIIIDTINLHEPPGTIHIFDYDGFKSRRISGHFSPHQIGIIEAIDIAGITDNLPKSITFFCCVPQNTDFGLGLSEELQTKVKEMAEKIVDFIKQNYNLELIKKDA